MAGRDRSILQKGAGEALAQDAAVYGNTVVQRVDVISGGFPCQDVSVAGNGAGLAGERSGLWREQIRTIRLVRPKYAVVENVAALLGRGMGQILGDLAESGYDAEWDCLPAVAFGAPHIRDRVFIVAYTEERGQPVCGSAPRETGHSPLSSEDVADAQEQPIRTGLRESEQGRQRGRRSSDSGSTGNVSDARKPGLSQPQPPAIFGARRGEERRAIAQCDWWAVEPNVGRVAHGIPSRVDRLKGLGNAVVPQIAEWIGKRIIEASQKDE